MAEQANPNQKRYAAEDLLAGFSKTTIGRYTLWAVAIHVVVIVATSYTYLRGWMDPEWARQQEELAQKAAEEEIKSDAGMQLGKAIQEDKNAKWQAAQSNRLAKAAAATNAANAAVELDRKIAEAFEKNGVDTNNPVVMERLKDVPKEMWTSQEIIDSVRSASPQEIPKDPGSGLDISLEETN